MKPLGGAVVKKPLGGAVVKKPLGGAVVKKPLGGALVTVLAVIAILVAQPRVTPLWSLYVGDRVAADSEVLFLEPFPDANSCGAAARALGTTGQWTACRARLMFSLSNSVRLITLQQEFVPGGAWERLEALCGLDRDASDHVRRPARAFSKPSNVKSS